MTKKETKERRLKYYQTIEVIKDKRQKELLRVWMEYQDSINDVRRSYRATILS